MQRYIDSLVKRGNLSAARVQILMAGVLSDVLREANEEAGGIIPWQEFANKALSEAANLQMEVAKGGGVGGFGAGGLAGGGVAREGVLVRGWVVLAGSPGSILCRWK